jgi:hypothetical protein
VSLDAVLLIVAIVLHLVGVVTMHLLIGLAALSPAAAIVGFLVVATRRELPTPGRHAVEVTR